jgi:hypothetical protein
LGDIALNAQKNLDGAEDFQIQCSEIASELLRANIRIGNLECTLPGGLPKLKGPHLIATVGTLRPLLDFGLDIVSRANNHVLDVGVGGFEKTSAWLQQNGILHVGAGTNLQAAQQPLVITTHIGNIGFLAYVDAGTHPVFATSTTAGANPFELSQALNDIKTLRDNCKLIIVLLHAGVQGYHYPEPRIVSAARKLVDAGADVVVMCHSHVLQGWEIWKGKPILYGLGNLTAPPIFDRDGKLHKIYVKKELEGAIAFITYEPGQKIFLSWKFTRYDHGAIYVDARTSRMQQIKFWSAVLRLPLWSVSWRFLRIRNDVIIRGWRYLCAMKRSNKGIGHGVLRLVTLLRISLFGQGDS